MNIYCKSERRKSTLLWIGTIYMCNVTLRDHYFNINNKSNDFKGLYDILNCILHPVKSINNIEIYFSHTTNLRWAGKLNITENLLFSAPQIKTKKKKN